VAPDQAVRFLAPKWRDTERTEDPDRGLTTLVLHTGQRVHISVTGNFNVEGKGWRPINDRLQDSLFPASIRERTRGIRTKIEGLNVELPSYFDEGINCIQYAQAPRAAIVLDWTGFVDLLTQRFVRELDALNSALTTYGDSQKDKRLNSYLPVTSAEELIRVPDFYLIEAAKVMRLLGKYDHARLQSMRLLRNNCAHVQEFAINAETALGFYNDLVDFLPKVL
jgi:hypothetical protein